MIPLNCSFSRLSGEQEGVFDLILHFFDASAVSQYLRVKELRVQLLDFRFLLLNVLFDLFDFSIGELPFASGLRFS